MTGKERTSSQGAGSIGNLTESKKGRTSTKWMIAFLCILVLLVIVVCFKGVSESIVVATLFLAVIAIFSLASSVELNRSVMNMKDAVVSSTTALRNAMVLPFIHVVGSSRKERQVARLKGELDNDEVKYGGIRIENLGSSDARAGLISVKVKDGEWLEGLGKTNEVSFFSIHPGQRYLYPNPGFPRMLEYMKKNRDMIEKNGNKILVKISYLDILGNKHDFGGTDGIEIQIEQALDQEAAIPQAYEVMEKLFNKFDLPTVVRIIEGLDTEAINRLLEEVARVLCRTRDKKETSEKKNDE